MSSTITERRGAGEFLISENGQRSRDQGVLLNSSASIATFLAGLVLAQRLLGTITAAKLSGAGNGAVTAPTAGARTQVGTYSLTAVSATLFTVLAPDGTRLADLTPGVAYTNAHLTGLLVAVGGTIWAAADVVQAIVPAGDGRWVPFTNATGLPATGILWETADALAASTGTARRTVLVRAAEINFAELFWDASLSGGALTTAQAAARVSLTAAAVIAR